MFRRGVGSGFSFVGMIVALTVVAMLSSIAGLYYSDVVEQNRKAVARNELDALAKHVSAYMSRHGGVEISTTTLQFLVDDGVLRVIPYDPWGEPYKIDPVAGVVYSDGADKYVAEDDIRVPYTRPVDLNAVLDVNPNPTEDRIPPVILKTYPTGDIRINNPPVYATFYDHYGGTINPALTRMWIDQQDASSLASSGQGVLTTSSSGQVIYTTNGAFSEGTHTVVVQVVDGAGNIARKEWTFVVDTTPAVARIASPSQSSYVCGMVNIEAVVREERCKRWSLEWDYQKLHVEVPSGSVDYPTTSPYTYSFDSSTVSEGLHYITLRLEDLSGRVYTDQVEVLVDNTPPEVYITAFPPIVNSGPPMVVATIAPSFKGKAIDNFGVQTALFCYRISGTGTITGKRGSVDVTDWQTAVNLDYGGDPLEHNASYYDSSFEEFSTTGVGVYVNTTLPPGTYLVEFKARDLAGNESTPATTEFRIDLFSGGIPTAYFADRRWVDSYSGTGKLYDVDRTISCMDSALIAGSVAYPDLVQTSGCVRFEVLEAMSGSVWEVVVDDAGGSPAADGSFTSAYPGPPSVPFDWTSTGSNDAATSVIRQSDWYGPYLDNWGYAFGARRGTPAAVPAGEYVARASYYGIGLPKHTTCTLLLDDSAPSPPDVYYVDGTGTWVPLPTTGTINAFSWNPSSPPYQFVMGGVTTDPGGLVERVGYVVYDGYVTSKPDISEYTWLYDRSLVDWDSHPPSESATFGDFPGHLASAGLMNFSTDDETAFDGEHTVFVVAEDGAGHTSISEHHFVFNAVGPLVEHCTFNKVEGAPVVLTYSSSYGQVLTCPYQLLDFSFQIKDEVDVTGVFYRIYPAGGAAGSPVSIAYGAPTPVVVKNNFIVTQDTLGSVFKSRPTSYVFELWGESSGTVGPVFSVKLEFAFLVDLAIFAPLYGETNGTVIDNLTRIMSKAEQEIVANYVFDHVDNVNTKVIYNYKGVAVRDDGYSGSVPDLKDWLSKNTSDGSTDVLVVLDVAPQCLVDADANGVLDTVAANAGGKLSPLARFLISDGNGDNKKDPAQDGDVMIFTGIAPFTHVVKTDGTLVNLKFKSGGANRLFDKENEADNALCQALCDQQNKNCNIKLDGKKSKMQVMRKNYIPYVPSMPFKHEPECLTNTDSDDVHQLKDKNEGEKVIDSSDDTNVGDYLLEAQLTYKEDESKNSFNFILKNTQTGGRYVQIFPYPDEGYDWGDETKNKGFDGSSSKSSFNTPMILLRGPVIEEIIENFIGLNGLDASLIMRPVVFRGDEQHAKSSVCDNTSPPPPQPGEDDIYVGYTYPEVKKYHDVTAKDGERAHLLDVSQGGSYVLFRSKQYDPALPGDSPPAANEVRLYAVKDFDPDKATLVFAGYDDPHANIIDGRIADNGRVVFITRSSANGASLLANRVLYYKENFSSPSPPTPLTSDSHHVGWKCHLSRNGRYIVFTSKRLYGYNVDGMSGDCVEDSVPPFQTLKTTGTFQIFRYDVDNIAHYTNGWVTHDTLSWDEKPSFQPGPRITDSGTTVVAVGRTTAYGNRRHLYVFKLQGSTWYGGFITKPLSAGIGDTENTVEYGGEDGGVFPKDWLFDITSQELYDGFPAVLFVSRQLYCEGPPHPGYTSPVELQSDDGLGDGGIGHDLCALKPGEDNGYTSESGASGDEQKLYLWRGPARAPLLLMWLDDNSNDYFRALSISSDGSEGAVLVECKILHYMKGRDILSTAIGGSLQWGERKFGDCKPRVFRFKIESGDTPSYGYIKQKEYYMIVPHLVSVADRWTRPRVFILH